MASETNWLIVFVVSAITMIFKATGFWLGRDASVVARMSRMTPAVVAGVLAAIVVTQVFTRGQHIVVDARLAGLGVAVIGAQRRWSPPLVIVLAAFATALIRRYA